MDVSLDAAAYDSAALLVDEALPDRPMRQWVLSVPHPPRYLFTSQLSRVIWHWAHPKKARKKSDGDANRSESSTIGATRPQLQSVSLADVMARQRSANVPSLNVGQDNNASSDTGRGTPAASDPISQDFVESFLAAAADPQAIVEETGHFLDTRLNTSDTRGDEGELFRRVLAGVSLSTEAVDAIRAEDDSGTITVNGEKVDVEFWSLGGFISDLGDSIGGAVSGVADGVSNAVNSVVDTVGNVASNVTATVGNLVTGAADVVGSVVSGAGNAVGGLLNSAGNAFGGGFGNFLSSAGNGISGFADSVGNGISTGVSWLNNHVLQPVINSGIELVQDLVSIATGIASFPLHVMGNAIDGVSETFGALLHGDSSGSWGSFTHMIKDLVLAPAELAVTTIALTANAGFNAINNLFGQTEERGLNQQEIDYLRPIYGNSIDYGSIRIQSGGIKEAVGISPQTTGNDIFLRQEWGVTSLKPTVRWPPSAGSRSRACVAKSEWWYYLCG